MTNSLYHYCSLDAFLKIVESKEVWLTNIFCMNDSAEHYWLRRIAKEMLDRDRDVPKSVNEFLASKLFSKEDETDVYCFCMSELGDCLGQWRGYADDGRGVAIGFSRQFLYAAEKEYRETGLQLKCVIYDRAQQERIVTDILENAKREDDPPPASSAPAEWMEQLPALVAESGIWLEAARCKNPFFAEEREVRLIYHASLGGRGSLGQRKYRACGDTLIPYHTLRLSPLPQMGSLPLIYEIVLGPKCNREFNEPIVRKILSDNGYNVNCLHVWSSEGTYR